MATIPVFVSSTFRDFQSERDLLNGVVRERLDELLRPLGCRVQFVDLRWGVDTTGDDSAQAARRVLDVCLDEVQRTTPLFLGLVGDRYGMLPDPTQWSDVAHRHNMDVHAADRVSITELEFGVAGLWPEVAGTRPVVLLRKLEGEVPPYARDDNPTGAQAFQRRLADRWGAGLVTYRTNWRGEGAVLDRVQTSAGEVAFEDLLVDLLRPPLEQRAREVRNDDLSHDEAFFRSQHAACELGDGGQRLMTVVSELAAQGGRMCLVGRSGSGRSSLLLQVEQRLQRRGHRTVTVLAAARPMPLDEMGLARELVMGLRGVAGLGAEHPNDTIGMANGLHEWFRDQVQRALTAAPTPPIVLVDGLELVSAEPAELWPVLALDEIGVVVSTTSENHMAHLKSGGFERHSIIDYPPEMVSKAAAMMAGWRTLPPTVVTELAREPRNPLWLSLAVELAGDLDADDFASIESLVPKDAAIADLLLKRVRDLPSDLWEVANVMLDRACAGVDPGMAAEACGLLALANEGLSNEELVELLARPAGGDYRALVVASLMRKLGGQLRPTGNQGRRIFDHAAVAEAATRRAPCDGHARLALLRNGQLDRPADGGDLHAVTFAELVPGARVADPRIRTLSSVVRHGLAARLEDSAAVAVPVVRALGELLFEGQRLLQDALLAGQGLDVLEASPNAAWTWSAVRHLDRLASGNALIERDRVRIARLVLRLLPDLPGGGPARRTLEMNAHRVLGAFGTDTSTARIYLDIALHLADELVEMRPGSGLALADRARVCRALAAHHASAGNTAEQLTWLESALRDLLAAVAEDDTRLEIHRQLAQSCCDLAQAHRAVEDAPQATRYFQMGLRVASRAEASWPEDDSALADEARARIGLAELSLTGGDPGGAREEADLARRLMAYTATAHPHMTETHRRLIRARLLLAETHLAAGGDLVESFAQGRQALPEVLDLLERGETRDELAHARDLLEQVVHLMGELTCRGETLARHAGGQLAKFTPRLLDLTPVKSASDPLLSEVLEALQRYEQVLVTSGFDSATKIHRLRGVQLDIARRRAEASPNDFEARVRLALHLYSTAASARVTGDLVVESDLMAQSLVIWDQLAREGVSRGELPLGIFAWCCRCHDALASNAIASPDTILTGPTLRLHLERAAGLAGLLESEHSLPSDEIRNLA